MSGVRVLVTGGAGYIGSHIITDLLASGQSVLSVDSFRNSRPEVYDAIAEITGRRLDHVRVDLRDTDALRAAVARFRPDAAIHLAGLKSVAEAAEDPLMYYDVNVGGSISLLRVLEEAGITRIVFSSSATVYGAARVLPVPETHPLCPANAYGRSKRHVEDILSDLAQSRPEMSVAILRYFNPVGCHPSARIGEWPLGPPANLMPMVAQVAAGLVPRLVVHGDDYDTCDGTGVRDYIHVMDLARAHTSALRWTAGARGARAFNLGVGRGMSVLEIVRTFERVTGRRVPFDIAARRPGDIATSLADPARAAVELGWTAELGPEEMCASVWAWQERLAAVGPPSRDR
jgi:UDP-glucose 4-epimerase